MELIIHEIMELIIHEIIEKIISHYEKGIEDLLTRKSNITEFISFHIWRCEV